MQPSVATNLETETSPGLLSALLGIYGLPYRWFTAYSYGKRLWTPGQVLAERGADLRFSLGGSGGHYHRQAQPLSRGVKLNVSQSVRVKCAQLNIFACPRDVREETHALYENQSMTSAETAKGPGKQMDSATGVRIKDGIQAACQSSGAKDWQPCHKSWCITNIAEVIKPRHGRWNFS